MTQAQARSPGEHARGPAAMMLFRAFLAQNVAIGCSFGGFSVSVLALQERYDSSRAVTAMGLALIVLVGGLLGPVAAAMIGRIGIRSTMVLGTLLSGAGYVVLAFAPSMLVALLAFGLLIGSGLAMFGPMPASILAANWYPEARGRAVGIANIPLFVALVPLLSLPVLAGYGLPVFFLCLAAMHLLLLPLMLGIRDAEAPAGLGLALAGGAMTAVTARAILRSPLFWAVVLGGGILNATGITAVSHIVAIAIEKGIPAGGAAALVSVMGGASILGSAMVGLLCDRIGGTRTLALAGLGLSASWVVVASIAWLPPIIVAMLLMGTCGAAVFPAVNVVASHRFGIEALPRTIAMFGLFTLPITFCLPPAAGWLRDATGNYMSVMTIIILCCGGVAALFLLAARATRSRAPALNAAG